MYAIVSNAVFGSLPIILFVTRILCIYDIIDFSIVQDLFITMYDVTLNHYNIINTIYIHK